MCSLVANAQENTDSISQDTSESKIEIKLSMPDFEKLKKERDDAISKYTILIEKYNNLIREDSVKTSKLKRLNTDYPKLQQKYDTLLRTQEKADKSLINTASNFLFIPYEAFSIQKVALPAFEAVYNQEMREKHIMTHHLLKSYRADIEDLLSFIIECENELSKPFTKNANEMLTRLRTMPFYERYIKYENWSTTFLGKKITILEKQLSMFDGKNHKFTPKALIAELEKCLKTDEEL